MADPTQTSPRRNPGRQHLLASCRRASRARVAGVFTEEFSPHPVETRFASTHYARLYLVPLFGSDPWEEKVDARYGVAESWTYLPGAKGIEIKLRKGLTFNNSEPITAKDVVFSIKLFMSKFAEDQVAAALRAVDVKMEIIDDHNLRIGFAKIVRHAHAKPTLCFDDRPHRPHRRLAPRPSAAFAPIRWRPGPTRWHRASAQQLIVLEAARKDPLLGCPTYDRVEIRNLPETGTRMAHSAPARSISSPATATHPAGKVDRGARGREARQQHDRPLHLPDLRGEQRLPRRARAPAAAHAIDHKLIAETIWKGIGVEPWGCTWPPSTEISRQNPAYEKACSTPYPYDRRAKQLLAEAGFATTRPAIRLTYWGNYPEEAALAEAMQPMLNEVGFNATVEKIDRVEYARRINNNGYSNSIMFFGPGGRVTSLAGSYFAYAGGMGPTQDKDVQNALARATGAATLDEYMAATSDIARLGHERAYAPGFFAAASIFFVRKDIPDWGLKRSVGRGPLNLVPLVTDLKP
jgi:hypothetical protein